MQTQTVASFYIIGIAVRTTNQNNQAAKDIPGLWDKFMAGQIQAKIPNAISTDIYCIYTEYEKDFMTPYTTILGCKVASLATIPEGMVAITINAGEYAKHTAKGNLMQGAVFNAWQKIWDSDLNRAYTADFEVYGEKAQQPQNAEVDIFIAIKTI
jgi:predicted transcriptional regulator YdeE